MALRPTRQQGRSLGLISRECGVSLTFLARLAHRYRVPVESPVVTLRAWSILHAGNTIGPKCVDPSFASRSLEDLCFGIQGHGELPCSSVTVPRSARAERTWRHPMFSTGWVMDDFLDRQAMVTAHVCVYWSVFSLLSHKIIRVTETRRSGRELIRTSSLPVRGCGRRGV